MLSRRINLLYGLLWIRHENMLQCSFNFLPVGLNRSLLFWIAAGVILPLSSNSSGNWGSGFLCVIPFCSPCYVEGFANSAHVGNEGAPRTIKGRPTRSKEKYVNATGARSLVSLLWFTSGRTPDVESCALP